MKCIALTSMTIDHIGAVLLSRLQNSNNGFCQHEIFDILYDSMRFIGRFAFPIYCFLLIEGFYHTKSRSKYALRLLLFAVLSEIPYDLAKSGTWYTPLYNNVFFTLLLGLLMIWVISSWKSICAKFFAVGTGKDFRSTVYCMGMIGIVFASMLIMLYLCKSDYSISGIIAIFCMYVLHDKPVLGFALGCIALIILNISVLQTAALLILPVISLYSGEKGKSMKYVFYAYYPGHLMLLSGICAALGILKQVS